VILYLLFWTYRWEKNKAQHLLISIFFLLSMVMFILLGFIDVIVGALMLATHLGLLHEWRIAFMGAIYLIAKAIALRKSFLSVLDILAGIYFILMMLGVRTFLVYVFLLIMIYKFVVSLMMRG